MASFKSDYGGLAAASTSVVADWVNFVAAINSRDQSGTVTDPESLAATRIRLFREQTQGTFIQLRMRYDDGLTSITDPVIKLFGRCSNAARGGTAGDWQILQTQGGSNTCTLTTAASDTEVTWSGVGFKGTTPSMTDHTFDCAGCDEFVAGVETALAATGTVSTAVVLAKFF